MQNSSRVSSGLPGFQQMGIVSSAPAESLEGTSVKHHPTSHHSPAVVSWATVIKSDIGVVGQMHSESIEDYRKGTET